MIVSIRQHHVSVEDIMAVLANVGLTIVRSGSSSGRVDSSTSIEHVPG